MTDNYLLQKIDCNCNNCAFMERDLATYQKWHDWHYIMDEEYFEIRKAKAITDAEVMINPKEREAMLRKANKMRFIFEKIHLLNYGNCTKLKKSVSFIPNVCQIETQNCFVHRKDISPIN